MIDLRETLRESFDSALEPSAYRGRLDETLRNEIEGTVRVRLWDATERRLRDTVSDSLSRVIKVSFKEELKHG